MKIVRSGRTKETCDRLEHNMPKGLKELPIVLNYGNSKYEDDNDCILINTHEAINNCVDKKKMFEHIKDYSVGYFDLDSEEEIIRAFNTLAMEKELVLRKGSIIKCVTDIEDFEELFQKYDYATLKEEKKFEYRILMFYGKVFKIMLKHKLNDKFVNKQINCKFINVDIDDFKDIHGSEVFNSLKKAVSELGINLCGVDLIVNSDDECKILEVNSGAGMSGKSVRLFYEKLSERFER